MNSAATRTDNTQPTSRPVKPGGEARRYFHAPNGWGGPVVFMLSMAAVGLSFYPAWLVVLAMLLQRFKTDRYEALVMLMIALGGYGLRPAPTIVECLLLYCTAIPLAFLLRKSAVTRRTLVIWGIYAAGCLVFAAISIESLMMQSLMLMWYLSFLFFLVPLWMFAGKSFSMDDFFNRLYPYVIIYAVFYWIDGLVLNGPVFLPQLQPFIGTPPFYNLYVIPLSMTVSRVYPPGLYLALMLMYPLIRSYRLRWWEGILLAVALMITKTFALITAVLLGFVICQRGFSKVSKYVVLSAGLLTALYVVDVSISDVKDIATQSGSRLRIASTINQFVILDGAQDEEDLAEFGTGRMAQIIPKVERLYEMGLEWTGFGFLHPTQSNNRAFVIENNLYSDISQNEETVATVEVVPVQVFLNIGYLGLIWHVLFLVALILVIRRLPDSKYFWTLMAMFIWLGISGFCGMVQVQGQMIVATAFAMVILQDKTRRGVNCGESPVLMTFRKR
ncbi:MAG: hypothetical protein K2G30_07370 [Muribaculaceae bacterium]|nr:hypothetical protein [Muribaculaceae bacterium]MDE7143132.1 hypothetical protein [Muribaculaceae bacterium]